MRHPRARLVGMLTLSVVAIAGCTSDSPTPEDTSTPPLSTYSPPHYSTAPPSSTPPITTGPNIRPGEKPPTVPAVAKTNTRAGALTFAVYWIQTIDWGYATVDATLARTAFSPVCTGCARFMKIFDNARDKGVHFRGGRMEISRWIIQPNDRHNGATAVVDVTASIGALQAIDRNGHVIESDPAHANVLYRVWLRWAGTRWTVVDSKLGVEK